MHSYFWKVIESAADNDWFRTWDNPFQATAVRQLQQNGVLYEIRSEAFDPLLHLGRLFDIVSAKEDVLHLLILIPCELMRTQCSLCLRLVAAWECHLNTPSH